MSRTMRSPMIRRPELQPKCSTNPWLLALVVYVSIIATTIFLNWTDRLSSGQQLLIGAVIFAIIALLAFRQAAHEEGMTSIEYLCYVVELARRCAW
jgi:hypothetical protein